jgi:hypothetical protein
VHEPYLAFCQTKLANQEPAGLSRPPRPVDLASRYQLFAFQADVTHQALERGRCAIFAQTGLGKTRMQLAWSDVIQRFTKGRVLICAPLAVASQTVAEGENIGVKVTKVRHPSECTAPGIYITNYEMVEAFGHVFFDAVVLDESSCLKHYMSVRKRYLVERFASTRFKLCCSATPAPNDHIELGNHSEFLGILPSSEMLSRWFINDTSLFGNYRVKGHAVEPFWDWVASWASCIGKPSDVRDDYDDTPYNLPPLTTKTHVLSVNVVEGRQADRLFRDHNMSATALHREKRLTLGPRVAKVAEIVRAEPGELWCIWCDTNYEADELLKVLPEAVDVRGDMSSEEKEARLLSFANGETRILLTKPKIAGLGLNLQKCARVAYVAPTFSYESDYQSLRRFHRFGQTREVVAHYVMAQTEVDVWAVMIEKAKKHESMARGMYDATRRRREKVSAAARPYEPKHVSTMPEWLRTEERA